MAGSRGSPTCNALEDVTIRNCQRGVFLDGNSQPVFDNVSIDLLNLDRYVCQAFEVIEIEACIESFQGSSQSKRTWTVE